MSVLQSLPIQLIQEGHVDEITLVLLVVHLLHSVWVALNTAECVAKAWFSLMYFLQVAAQNAGYIAHKNRYGRMAVMAPVVLCYLPFSHTQIKCYISVKL